MIFTAGYGSGLRAAELQRWLEAKDAVVADVRLVPASQFAEWRVSALRARLGSRYVHVRAFGNLAYRFGGPVRLEDELAGVLIVRELLRVRPVVLLCGCGSPRGCHRTDAALAVQRVTGDEVRHLRRRDFWGQLDLLEGA